MNTSHTITISTAYKYSHGEAGSSSVTVAGDGSEEHYLQTFQASMVAAGFDPITAARVVLDNEQPMLTGAAG